MIRREKRVDVKSVALNVGNSVLAVDVCDCVANPQAGHNAWPKFFVYDPVDCASEGSQPQEIVDVLRILSRLPGMVPVDPFRYSLRPPTGRLSPLNGPLRLELGELPPPARLRSLVKLFGPVLAVEVSEEHGQDD
jgi:hypothetical protein